MEQVFLSQAECPACRPTNSVKALKATDSTDANQKQGSAVADKPARNPCDALHHGERAANKYGGRSV